MLNLFKKFALSMMRSFPVIRPVDFSDGLLAFRCDRALPFEPVMVATLTSSGSITTEVKVCSYDMGQRLYRGQLADCGNILERLGVPARETVRLTQSLRVSSRQIPKYFALTEDISVSGIRLATSGMLSVGTSMDMAIDLDDACVPTVNVKGEVRWSAMKVDGSYHSGIHFVGVDSGQGRVLQRYIESRQAAHRTVHGEG